MGSLDTPPSWADPIVLASIERAFDATWPVIRAHEAGANKARMSELSMAQPQAHRTRIRGHNRSAGASEVSVRGFPRLQRLGAAGWPRDVLGSLAAAAWGVMLFDLVRKGERQRCQVTPQVLDRTAVEAGALPR